MQIWIWAIKSWQDAPVSRLMTFCFYTVEPLQTCYSVITIPALHPFHTLGSNNCFLNIESYDLIYFPNWKSNRHVSLGIVLRKKNLSCVALWAFCQRGSKKASITAKRWHTEATEGVWLGCCQRHPLKMNDFTRRLSCETRFGFSYKIFGSLSAFWGIVSILNIPEYVAIKLYYTQTCKCFDHIF